MSAAPFNTTRFRGKMGAVRHARSPRRSPVPRQSVCASRFGFDAEAPILMSEAVAVVLAAGKGTRMDSDLPKVLVEVCGRPMIEYVLDALARAGIRRAVVVIGHRADLVRKRLAGRPDVQFAVQPACQCFCF